MGNIWKWVFVLLLALAGNLVAQVTAPVPVTYKVKETTSMTALPVVGDLLQADGVTIKTGRPDTVNPFLVRAIVEAAPDSNHVILGATVRWAGQVPYAFKDTIRTVGEIVWPQWDITDPVRQMPDSLLYIHLKNRKPNVGDEFKIENAVVPASDGKVVFLEFPQDTLKGTKVDTSGAVYLAGGADAVTFAYQASKATAAVYEVLYNFGFGWGLASPSDTLADSLFTRTATANTWRFRDVGALMEAQFIRVIRRGKATTDTARISQSLRIRAR